MRHIMLERSAFAASVALASVLLLSVKTAQAQSIQQIASSVQLATTATTLVTAQEEKKEKAGYTYDALIKSVEADIVNRPRQCTSYVAVEREGQWFHVVTTIKDADKETNFLVQGEKVVWWFQNPVGEASILFGKGLGSKQDGTLADFTISGKIVPNFKDENGKMSSARLDLFVAPGKVCKTGVDLTVGSPPVPGKVGTHPAERIRVPIREK